MSKKQKRTSISVIVLLVVVFFIGSMLLNGSYSSGESISEVMRDAVLHETNKVNLFGIVDVNPAYVSSLIVCACLLLFAAIVRIFFIPRFKIVPGKFQLLLETLVGLFDSMAKSNSPERNKFLRAYIFGAGCYIFTGTFFELFGIQVVSTAGISTALPAPMSDINCAIALGVFSYGVIMSGGIAGNGIKGIGLTLKEFSLPISMSFRLFGALLSGLLVTELVYYNIYLSFVLPVLVGILFTLLHALIQAYVLTMLTALFYGEVSEKTEKKEKKPKKVKAR